MFWKTKSSAQLPVFVARGYETPPKTTDGSQADVQPSQPASNFEGDAQRILEGEMAEIWLASSSGTERPAAQLVALAAQACREVAPGASAERLPDESVFTERLNSLQGYFLCAEANLGSNNTKLPLLVLAIGQNMLSWKQYAEELPAPTSAVPALKGFGHFHPAVQNAASQKLPLQQLAWLLHDQKCRMIICGHGPAGAVAQHAALVIKQHLKALLPDEDKETYLSRVLCITFGAPPSSLSVSGAQVNTLSTVCDGGPGLFWNFLLVEDRLLTGLCLLDLMPAVLSSIPKDSRTAKRWLDAVDDLWITSQSKNHAPDTKEYLEELVAAGMTLNPDYLGSTWFLSQNAELRQARMLRRALHIDSVDASQLCKPGNLDYFELARNAGKSLYELESMAPLGLLDCLKLGQNLPGFFKALTAAPPCKAWYQRRAAEPDQAMPMIGCHITMQGKGVQWMHAENMRVEMVGGVHGQVTLKLNPPEPARVPVQSAYNASHKDDAPGTESNAKQTGQSPGKAQHVLEQVRQLASGARYACQVTVYGQMEEVAGYLRVLPPDRRVQVLLHMETAFERRKVVLTVEHAEEDAQGFKGKLGSGALEDQLQRAILFATCCLASHEEQFRKLGSEVLESIDALEQWCRAVPKDEGLLSGWFTKVTNKPVEWSVETVKDILLACSQVTGETVSGGLNSYEELHKGEYKWQANSKAIAAVLASPLWLQYKPEAIDYAVNVTLLGLSVACIVVPVAIPAVAGVAIACIALRATSAFATAAQLAYSAWGMRQVYLAAYLAKLEQIVLLLEPDSHPQRDTSALEQIVYQECSEHVQSASSALGRVLMGPTPSPFWLEQHKLPAALPLWTSAELHKQPNFILSNGRRLTTSCLLEFHAHLNRICAVHQLRQSVRDVCLVGCVGEENAGKTTLIRKLVGLPLIADAHTTKKATNCATVYPMPIHAGCFKAYESSPFLVDTPGMFDQRQTLADSALQHLGSMALHIAVLSPQKSGRIDINMLTRLARIASDERPTLVCINQMSRYLDWYKTAEEGLAACEDARADIIQKAKGDWGPCGSVTVFLTDFAPVAENQCLIDEMRKRDIKSLEAVRDWICRTARECGYDVPQNSP